MWMLNVLWEVHSFEFRISLDWGVPQWFCFLKVTLITFFLISFHFLSLFVVMHFSSWCSKVFCVCHACWVPCWGQPTPVYFSPEELVLCKILKSLQLLTGKGPWCLLAGVCCGSKVCVLVTKAGEVKFVFVSYGRKCLARSEKMLPVNTCICMDCDLELEQKTDLVTQNFKTLYVICRL